MFVFEPEGSSCFSSGKSENLSGDFRFPELISTSAAPMKYRYPILSRSFLETEIRSCTKEKSPKKRLATLLTFPKKTT